MIERVDTPVWVVAQLRAIAMSLAGSVEDVGASGQPVWKVRRRTFLNVATVDGPARTAVTVITVRAEPEEISALAGLGHPYFLPRSANARGWIGLVIDDVADWEEIAELISESHRLALQRLTSQR